MRVLFVFLCIIIASKSTAPFGRWSSLGLFDDHPENNLETNLGNDLEL